MGVIRRKRTSIFQNKKTFLVIFVITAVAIGIFLVSYFDQKKIAKQKDFPILTPTLDSSSATVKDGVYTNYKYGFKFKYPEEIFPYMRVDINSGNATFYESRSESTGSSDEWIGEGLWLYTGISEEKYRQYSIDEFERNEKRSINTPNYSEEEYLKSKPNNKWPGRDDFKVEDIEKSGFKGYVLYTYPVKGGDGGETPYGYHIDWKIGDLVIGVGIYNGNQSRKQLQLKIIKDIINSFEFFTPASMY